MFHTFLPQLCPLYCVHALHAVYAALSHGLAGPYVLHRPTGIALYDELDGKQKHCHANNSEGKKQYFQHFVRLSNEYFLLLQRKDSVKFRATRFMLSTLTLISKNKINF